MECNIRGQNAKFPQTALAFYIKLYCKRKASSKTKYASNLVEATKAWLSLNGPEKDQIQKAYEEYKHKFKLQCFTQLKNAEPFMKVKDSRLEHVSLSKTSLEIKEPTQDYTKEVTSQTDVDLITSVNELEPIENDEQIADLEHRQLMDEQNDMENVSEDRTQLPQTRTVLVEPLPPTLKTGKDLFNLLKSMDEANSTWALLSQSERNQYKRAVFILKNDYIIKFKQYLESLSSKELFDYYNKAIF